MATGGIVDVATFDRMAEFGDGCGELLFHMLLGGPADSIGRVAEISGSNKCDSWNVLIAGHDGLDRLAVCAARWR